MCKKREDTEDSEDYRIINCILLVLMLIELVYFVVRDYRLYLRSLIQWTADVLVISYQLSAFSH